MNDNLKDKKILFAPHEIGGQMQLMVEEMRRRGLYATAATYTQEWFGHNSDISLKLDQHGAARKQLISFTFFLWAASNFDIIHFFWGESLYGTRLTPRLDLPILRRLNKKIFVHFRGLDVIDLAYFDYLRSRNLTDEVEEPPMSRDDQIRSLKQWRKYSDAMLVSEPDLFRVVPEAIMVQQAIDLDYWRPSGGANGASDGVIRIAHAPSMRR
ncbi:MAG: hypothetical protein R3335_08735, partial [Anaerolineales bacterium]|nr:hypothetical protein [Anaerolineales bacterium]